MFYGKNMARIKTEETLRIEIGSEYVTVDNPYKVKKDLNP